MINYSVQLSEVAQVVAKIKCCARL